MFSAIFHPAFNTFMCTFDHYCLLAFISMLNISSFFIFQYFIFNFTRVFFPPLILYSAFYLCSFICILVHYRINLTLIFTLGHTSIFSFYFYSSHLTFISCLQYITFRHSIRLSESQFIIVYHPWSFLIGHTPLSIFNLLYYHFYLKEQSFLFLLFNGLFSYIVYHCIYFLTGYHDTITTIIVFIIISIIVKDCFIHHVLFAILRSPLSL